jgi:hypothetical protein
VTVGAGDERERQAGRSGSEYVPGMGHDKNKGGREAKKPKKDKKAKPATQAPVIPVSPHAHDASHK